MGFSKQSTVVFLILLCAAIAITANVSRGKSVNELQDPASLDRRISMLEQRFYTMESNINRLQQYVTTQHPPTTSPSTSDRDLILMRDDLERLTLRLSEVECGLLKLDERTTAPARRNQKSADLCRQNPDMPVRLSARP